MTLPGYLLVGSFAILVAGCCNSKGGSAECKAELEYGSGNYSPSKPFVGKGGGETKESAQSNACWDYCFEADPAFEGIFQIWLSGKDGKAYQSKGKPMTKRRIIIDDNTSLEEPFAKCVDRCKGDATSGRNGLKYRPTTCG